MTTARGQRVELARARAAAGRKPGAGAPAYLRWVNRPAGAVVARQAFASGWTPDQVTIAGVATAGCGLLAVLAATRWPWASVPGAVLLLVAYVLDSADGQLARLRGGGSAAGEWLDHVVDVGKTSAVHAVAVVVVLTHRPAPPVGWVATPLVAGTVAVTGFFALVLRDQLLRDRPVPERPATGAGRMRGLGTLLYDHALLCVVMATAGWTDLFLTTYTTYTVATCALLTRALWQARTALRASPAQIQDRCTRSQS